MIAPFKKKSLDRLKRAKGQIEGIINMIEDEKYCVDIITQLLALQGALKGVSPLVLESHLHSCGQEHMGSRDAKKREKFIKELVKTCELSNR